jgi:hypothetical protein
MLASVKFLAALTAMLFIDFNFVVIHLALRSDSNFSKIDNLH